MGPRKVYSFFIFYFFYDAVNQWILVVFVLIHEPDMWLLPKPIAISTGILAALTCFLTIKLPILILLVSDQREWVA